MISRLFKSKLTVILIICLVVVLFFGVPNLPFSTYHPGWEIRTELVAFEVNGEVTNNPPYVGTYGDWMGPGQERSVYKFQSGSNLQWDFDDAGYGMPDIKATISDVREETPKFPYAPLQNDVDDFRYVTEYHEYLFDIQVRTIADMQGQDGQARGLKTTKIWTHETSMPHQWVDNYGSGGGKIGKAFSGGVYARFATLPWGTLDYGPIPEGYEFNGYWLGVMNAKVQDTVYGVATPDIEITDKGWVRNIESIGSQLNMYKDDGTYVKGYASVPWTPDKILDPDISAVVIIFVPFDLMAGAWAKYDQWAYGWDGGIVECKPIDYYLTYTVRMECLVTKEYEARDPATSPNPSPIETPTDYVPYTPWSWWDKYGTYIIIGAIVVVILMIAGFWISLPLLGFCGGGWR